MTDLKEAISKAPSGRVKRTPLGQRNVLTVKNKDPNYHYRIVNDAGDNIQRRLDLGYAITEDASKDVGDKRVSSGTPIGNMISVGQGTKAVVMRIPKEFHEEDAKYVEDKATQQEAAIKEKALSGTYGNLEITRR